MHEFTLAQGLHDQLMSLVREHDMKKVKKAEISIGDNAGIVVDSFTFGLNVLAGQNDATKKMIVDVIEDVGKDLILQRVELE